MFTFKETATAKSIEAAMLIAGVALDEIDEAYMLYEGAFFVDGMKKPAYGIYYSVEYSPDVEGRCFVSFDGLVEGWKTETCYGIDYDWGFRDNR